MDQCGYVGHGSENYVLYCVKYINKWHATYLRRGIDQITENGSTTTNVRHEQYIEDDEICNVTTKDLHTAIFPVSTTVGQETLTCDLVLTFNDNDECTITSGTEGLQQVETESSLLTVIKPAGGMKKTAMHSTWIITLTSEPSNTTRKTHWSFKPVAWLTKNLVLYIKNK